MDQDRGGAEGDGREVGHAGAAHDPYAVFRDRNYRRFLLAGMAATIGGQMQGVAVGWELYERTSSPLALGLVGLAQVLPVILLAIPAGHAGRPAQPQGTGHRRPLRLAGRGLGLAALSFTRGPIGMSYLFLVMTGVGQAVNRPARWAILPQIVPRELLLSAVTWNTSSWQVAAMVGPALGGLVIALAGGACGLYLHRRGRAPALVIVLTASFRLRPVAQRLAAGVARIRSWRGSRFVLRTELILATITLDLFAVFLGGATALLPIFAEDILRIGPTGLGWLRRALDRGVPDGDRAGSPASDAAGRAGPPLGGRRLRRRDARLRPVHEPLPFVRHALLTGAFDNISVVVRQTLVQVLTPDEMRGRVSAVNAIFIGSSNELGEFESGLAARLLGAVPAVALGGLGTLLVVVGVASVWPGLIKLGSLHDVKPAEA